jgi:hypothetical protein
VSSRRLRMWTLCAFALACVSGCSLAPKGFGGIKKPEPLVRARAIPLGRNKSDEKVVPSLITSLDDKDAVVRMTASEELKKRSGQDFGYVPYAEPEERAPAVSKWNAWWAARQASLANLRPRRMRRESRVARPPLLSPTP